VTLTATSGTFSFPAEGPWDITATYGSGNAGSCALDIEQAAASSWYTVTSSTFGFLARDAQYTFSEEGCTVTLAAVCSGVRTDCVPETTFGAFGACSASCGGGTMTATRSVITEASHGGDACVLTRTETCNEDPCPWSGCYQAEDGYLANGATFETANSGAMGTGYVHFQKDPNEELWWKVNVPTNGRYNLVFRYNTEGTGASSSDSHGLQVQTVEGCALNIDNKYSEVISFPASTSWAETSMNVDLPRHQHCQDRHPHPVRPEPRPGLRDQDARPQSLHTGHRQEPRMGCLCHHRCLQLRCAGSRVPLHICE